MLYWNLLGKQRHSLVVSSAQIDLITKLMNYFRINYFTFDDSIGLINSMYNNDALQFIDYNNCLKFSHHLKTVCNYFQQKEQCSNVAHLPDICLSIICVQLGQNRRKSVNCVIVWEGIDPSKLNFATQLSYTYMYMQAYSKLSVK